MKITKEEIQEWKRMLPAEGSIVARLLTEREEMEKLLARMLAAAKGADCGHYSWQRLTWTEGQFATQVDLYRMPQSRYPGVRP